MIARHQKSTPLRQEKPTPAKGVFAKRHVQSLRLGENLGGGLDIAQRKVRFSHPCGEYRVHLYDAAFEAGLPALPQDRQRFHMPALGNPEPGKDMRYVRTRIEMILRFCEGIIGDDFGPFHFPDFDQGIGEESTKHDAWIGRPAGALGIQLRTFERETLFVYLDRLSVSTGFVEHHADVVQ